MSLSDREIYRRECKDIATSDPRWRRSSESDECVRCGSFMNFIAPNGKTICPACWDWIGDSAAPSVPMTPKPLSKEDEKALKIKCTCGHDDIPNCRWKHPGTKKEFHLAAYCKKCNAWIKWLQDVRLYEKFADPKPHEGTLFENATATKSFGMEDPLKGAKQTLSPPKGAKKAEEGEVVQKSEPETVEQKAAREIFRLRDADSPVGRATLTKFWKFVRDADALRVLAYLDSRWKQAGGISCCSVCEKVTVWTAPNNKPMCPHCWWKVESTWKAEHSKRIYADKDWKRTSNLVTFKEGVITWSDPAEACVVCQDPTRKRYKETPLHPWCMAECAAPHNVEEAEPRGLF